MKLSACMIVKNEEELLPGCLDSIKNVVDEIIIVDTGSTDRTIDIAKNYGAKNYYHKWENDFSLHRNQAFGHATGDWYLVIDADERLTEETVKKIRDTIESSEFKALSIKVTSPHTKLTGHITNSYSFQLRLFKADIEPKYYDRAHNRPSFKAGTAFDRTALEITHLGFDLDEVSRTKKYKRTLSLLNKQVEESKGVDTEKYIRSLRYLAQHYRTENGKPNSENADTIIELASNVYELTDITKSEKWRSYVMSSELLACSFFYKKMYPQALVFSLNALRHKPDYMDCLIWLGYSYIGIRKYEKAIEIFNRYLTVHSNYDPGKDMDGVLMNLADHRHVAENGKEEATAHLNEKNALYYDAIYKEGYNTTTYDVIYDTVMNLLKENKDKTVLEIGCGTGDLASKIKDNCEKYIGFDISKEGISQTKEKLEAAPDKFTITGELIQPKVFEGNAYDSRIYKEYDTDVIIAIEVLEHLFDKKVIAAIPDNRRIIFSVPNYPDPAHLRVYNNEEQIKERFKGLLTITNIITFYTGDDNKIFLCEALTGEHYASERDSSERSNLSQCEQRV